MQIILGLILLFVVLFVLSKLSKFVLKLAGGLLLAIIAVAGIPGYLIAQLFIRFHIQLVGLYVVVLVGCALPFINSHYYEKVGYLSFNSFSTGKYLVILPLYFLLIPTLKNFTNKTKIIAWNDLFESKKNDFYSWAFVSLAFFIFSAFDWTPIYFASLFFDLDKPVLGADFWFILTFWIFGILAAILSLLSLHDTQRVTQLISNLMNPEKKINKKDIWEKANSEKGTLSEEDLNQLLDFILLEEMEAGQINIVEFEEGEEVVLNSDFYTECLKSVESESSLYDRVPKMQMGQIVKRYFDFSEIEANYFAENYVERGEYRNFADGVFFTSYSKTNVRTCSCCGISELEAPPEESEWYCSKICIETERYCDDLKKQGVQEFIDNSITSGFVLVANADAWVENQKVFSIGGQGHGFAAENANHMIDSLRGKKAAIVGSDNAKDGADRLVDGQYIQTKYCGTGARSIGAAFDGQEGNYRYYQDGKPMELEVPRDQYASAVKTMKQKISDGKVPGIDDPSEAENIVRKGNVTYQQARNITRFGTSESLTYDFLEGAVVSLSAAGVSASVTTIVVYAQTKDKSSAIRAGLISSLKVYGKSTSLYVTVQQLHRLEVIQKALSHIDISHFPDSLRSLVMRGTGKTSTNAANSALRGTVLTSVVLVAVTTGPDILKFCRGRISGQQFIKNLAVVATSTVGGVVGSFAGAAVMSPLGPAGVLAGRFVGGVVGSALTGWTAKTISNSIVEDDQVLVIKIIVQQMEYLAKVFMLSESEIENLNENFSKILNQTLVEKIFAAKNNRIPVANEALKPIVVGIVKQRFSLPYDDGDIEQQSRLLEDEYRFLKPA